jgi:hypothetical protein
MDRQSLRQRLPRGASRRSRAEALKLAAALLGFVALAAPASAQQVAVGRVKTVEGSATVTTGGAKSAASVGTALHEGDVIETGPNGSIGVSFKDDSIVSLGANSRLTVDRFVFEPAQEKYGFAARMARGTAYFVSGGIAKLSPESVAVTTPVGTIGVRGTRFVVKLDDD